MNNKKIVLGKSNNNIATFEDFKKLEIRIGKIITADKIEGADRLLKLDVDFGEFKRQIVSGIAEFYPAPQRPARQSVGLMEIREAKCLMPDRKVVGAGFTSPKT